jgi:hypothetical protein
MLGMCVVTAAREKAPDAYVKAMKDIDAANKALRGHTAATPKDYEAIAKDAAAFKDPLEAGAKFWEARKDAEAAGVARGALKAAGELEAAAKAKNDDGIAAASRIVGGSCRTCHTAHRQMNADGSYEIK